MTGARAGDHDHARLRRAARARVAGVDRARAARALVGQARLEHAAVLDHAGRAARRRLPPELGLRRGRWRDAARRGVPRGGGARASVSAWSARPPSRSTPRRRPHRDDLPHDRRVPRRPAARRGRARSAFDRLAEHLQRHHDPGAPMSTATTSSPASTSSLCPTRDLDDGDRVLRRRARPPGRASGSARGRAAGASSRPARSPRRDPGASRASSSSQHGPIALQSRTSRPRAPSSSHGR